MSWDELAHRDHGALVYRYMTSGDSALFSSPERYHGPLIPTLYYAIEKSIGLTDSQSIFYLYHFLGFLLFILGIGAFYGLSEELFSNKGISIIGCICLFLSPRLFAESFYNNNDIPCMVFFILSAWTGLKWLRTEKWHWGLFHALCCAWVTDIRILGILAPCLTVGMLILKDRKNSLKALLFLALYFSLMVVFWPVTWHSPLKEFLNAFQEMKQFPWNGQVLYMGHFYQASKLPWHYLIGWITITTPVLYLVFALIGAWSWSWRPSRLWVALWPVLPIGCLIGLHSVVYDGWRHVYFIYPALLCFSLEGLRTVLSLKKPLKITILFLSGISLLFVALSMVEDHPFQNVYFNRLAGKPTTLKENYELDYWGLSYKKALEYIIAASSTFPVTVIAANDPGRYNLVMLPLEDRNKIQFTADPAQAKYFITNYRWHPEDYPLPEPFTVIANGTKIMSVYTLKP